ncbi:tail fiber protein [Pseudomonas proteolytica]|uniref:tail fiber protein n=1 Tax=Pseudomonas proteolytica TaxID=219574 RepID=UPI001F0355B0|nr:tail fiber protein [Pseudomonas proteolytica]
MDFPKSVPNAGLVNGQFVDENVGTGQPGSLIPAEWGNSVTHEMLNVIKAAGLVPDEAVDNQLDAAINKKITSGIPAFATQVEAEAGASATKVMSPLRVFQAIAKVVIQATETVRGLARIASTAQIVVGTDDTTIVTPLKLRSAYGIGNAPALTNLDTAGAGPFIAAGSAAGAPPAMLAGDYCTGYTTLGDAVAVRTQVVLIVNTGKMYRRTYGAGNWGLWGAIIDAGDFASEAIAGIMRIATAAQTNAGMDNATAITPQKLRNAYGIGNAPGLTNLNTAGPGPFIAAGSAAGAPPAMSAGDYCTGYTTLGDAVAVRTQVVLIVSTGKMYRRTYGAGSWGLWGAIIDAGDFATETSLGVARIATTAQIDAGTDDTTIVTPLKLRNAVPVGASVGFYAASPPVGWLKENGAAVSRTTYANLFSVIGTRFGAGNGSTTFNVPDSRSLFSRALDDSKGIDVGRVNGSTQPQSIQSHSHAILNKAASFVFSASGGGNVPGASTTGATEVTGGAETRPANIAKLYCIKY